MGIRWAGGHLGPLLTLAGWHTVALIVVALRRHRATGASHRCGIVRPRRSVASFSHVAQSRRSASRAIRSGHLVGIGVRACLGPFVVVLDGVGVGSLCWSWPVCRCT